MDNINKPELNDEKVKKPSLGEIAEESKAERGGIMNDMAGDLLGDPTTYFNTDEFDKNIEKQKKAGVKISTQGGLENTGTDIRDGELRTDKSDDSLSNDDEDEPINLSGRRGGSIL